MTFRILVPLLFLLFSCADKDTSARPLLHFVPENAFLIVKIENHGEFKNLVENNDFFEDLASSESYKTVLDKVQYLKHVSPKSESILTLTETEDRHFEFLYATENTANLFNLDSTQNKAIKRVELANSTLEQYKVNDLLFYSLIKNQKVLISSSKSLLEKFNTNTPNQRSETLRKLFEVTDKKKPASIFVNMDNSNSLLSTILKEDSKIKVSGFSDWVSLDLNINQNKLSLSGVSIANDSTWNYVNLFNNTKPTSNNIASYAPSQTDAILSYSFDNYEAFAKNRELSSGIVSPIEPSMNSVEEIGIVYLNSEKAVVLNTIGAEAISEFLLSLKKASIEYQGQEILQLNKRDFLNNRFSPIIENYNANFCVFLGNAIVFSETIEVIKSIINNYKNASTFNKTPVFKTLNGEIAKESSILFISNSENIKKIVKEDFSSDFLTDLEKIKLSKYGFAAQATTDKNFYHTNIVIKKIVDQIGTTSSGSNLFKVDFDSQLATNPQFVTNHETGRKEILVQDQDNVLYLVSGKGKILWKKQLTSLIQGKVKQVDLFKNGRLQFAFTTNNQFLILDRKGREVKNFTKTYEGGNLNPLSVFDYEKKKNYRFVVTQGEKTFMYDNKASIVKGFTYTKAEQPIIAAPKHIVIGNKDFLVFKLKDGSLKLLSRVGEVRIPVAEKIDFSENEVYKYKDKFSVTDKKGVLYQIDLNGKITKTNFNLSNDHGMASTDNTLVLMNENVLTIKGKKVELELGVYTKPKIFYLNKKLYVSVTDLQNEKVYLFDSQAKAIKNFPTNGSSIIDLEDIEKNKTLEVLVKESSNAIVVYEI